MTSRGSAVRLVLILLSLSTLVPGGCRTWSSREEQAAVFYNQANALREAGRLPEAAEAYRQALERYPDMNAAAFNLALTLVELGEYDDAIDGLETLSEADPANISILKALGWAARRAGRPESALEYYLAVLDVFPADTDALRVASEVYEELDRAPESVELRRQLVELEDSTGSMIDLAEALGAAGRPEESLDMYRAVLIREPRNQAALEGAAAAALERESYAIAVDYLNRSAANASNAAEVWWTIARVKLVTIGDYQGGLDSLKRALEEGFSDQEAMSELLSSAPASIKPAVMNLLPAPAEQ